MASQYYGIERGQTQDGVTTGSSTTSKKLEVVLDLTGGFTQAEVLMALEYIKNFILNSSSFPPA